ncbi:hypothetical protein RGQ29_005456 [Quercus rubra]|uniref:Uncharacterized protein n=1 Tax=Quercus rubra TaxID=3512 RepID=A0AAN7E4M7_QUERU|nr:hypothetical protein RGQ29_005456 [Quercus rubra]KAK4562978.1 hypothetical protein RGQ29_005456 [Quercus rubra]
MISSYFNSSMIAFRDSGLLSRNCKGISDLYGFILYALVISDRSVFKLSELPGFMLILAN